MNQQSEALKIASEIELAITCGFIGSAAQYDRLLLSAVSQLRAPHAHVEELEKDRENAKRLVSKIWNQHPEARDTIEKATGAWLVFGQDVETGGVSAQRVTQVADHIAQDRKMVAAQEPFGYFKQDTYGWMDCSKDADGAIALYKAPQPQTDARAAERLDALYKALEVCSAELFAQCSHQGRAMKYVEQARKALAAEQCARAAIAAAKEMK